jgi:hypothetical protein
MSRAEKGLQVSFSNNVVYSDIAPYVDLDPNQNYRDAPTFQLNRARLPTALFKEIVQDIQIIMKQYGPPIDHQNVEARSRFLAPVGIHVTITSSGRTFVT